MPGRGREIGGKDNIGDWEKNIMGFSVEDISSGDVIGLIWDLHKSEFKSPPFSPNENIRNFLVIRKDPKDNGLLLWCPYPDIYSKLTYAVALNAEMAKTHNIPLNLTGISTFWQFTYNKIVTLDKPIPENTAAQVVMSWSEDSQYWRIVKNTDKTTKLVNCTVISWILPNNFATTHKYLIQVQDNKYDYGSPLTQNDIDFYKVDPKYIGTKVIEVFHDALRLDVKNEPKGMTCSYRFCKTFCPYMEEPNFPNDVFLCYSCKTNPIIVSLVTDP